MLNVFKTVIQYFGRTLNIYLYIFICFHIAIYLLDVQTFKIHQMKRIEKTNLTLVIYDGFEYVNNGHSTLADCSFATNNLSHINQSFNESGFKTKDNCIVSQ